MLSLPASVRVFAARDRVDFRKGFDGLVQIIRDVFSEDPFVDDLFCFFNRRRDRVKVLVWDRNGFMLLCRSGPMLTLTSPSPIRQGPAQIRPSPRSRVRV